MKSAGLAVMLLLLSALVGCGGNPPQIVDYAPERGAKEVSTGAPISITFDHAVDQRSVESRLFLQPTTPTTVRWTNPRELVLQHTTLMTNTTYEVILEAGYQDLVGNTYTLRHHWSFVTEAPASLVSAAPADREQGVDPAAYLTLEFTRDMNPTTLLGAITLSPAAPFSARLDPTDGRRAIVAPNSLLSPNTQYSLTVGSSALDADGNELDRDRTLTFTTGPARPLRHWIGFATRLSDGSSTGVWIVNEAGFPRRLAGPNVMGGFSWSPDGSNLLVQTGPQSWAALTPGADSVRLGFSGAWAEALGAGLGYVYLDTRGALHRWSADGIDDLIASDVSAATVAPNGQRVAYVRADGSSSVLWGYDAGLKASYEIVTETGEITNPRWAPSGNRIAYLRQEATGETLRVRNLVGAATTVTIGTGDIGRPSWLSDSTHLLFTAALAAQSGPVNRTFLVSVVAPPPALTPAIALPSDASLTVTDPVASPDGHQIAFLSQGQVWIMNADGTRPTMLTKFDPDRFPYSCDALAWTRA